MVDEGIIEKVVRLLVTVRSPADVERACIKGLSLTKKETARAIATAKRRITRASKIHVDNEFGRAVIRLHDLYERSLAASDIKTALASAKELNRLLELYKRPADDDETDELIAKVEATLAGMEAKGK